MHDTKLLFDNICHPKVEKYLQDHYTTHYKLSKREFKIIYMILSMKYERNLDIGKELSIAERTVKFNSHNIYKKLNFNLGRKHFIFKTLPFGLLKVLEEVQTGGSSDLPLT